MQAVASALPPAVRRKDKNPARRTFQALRIAVNGELDALSEGLDVLFAALKPGGLHVRHHVPFLEDRSSSSGSASGPRPAPAAGVPGVRMRREGQGKAHYQKAR